MWFDSFVLLLILHWHDSLGFGSVGTSQWGCARIRSSCSLRRFQPSLVKSSPTITCLDATSKSKTYVAKEQEQLQERWFPRTLSSQKHLQRDDDDIYGNTLDDEDLDDADDEDYGIESQAVQLLAGLIQERLGKLSDNVENANPSSIINSDSELNTYSYPAIDPARLKRNQQLVKGRFMDLACTREGEELLESIFLTPNATKVENPRVIQAAVMALQSVCVLGTQVGVKGTPAQLQRMIAHLDNRGFEAQYQQRDLDRWDRESVRRLKYKLDRSPGIQLLAALHWRRTTQGAFELLVHLGAWSKHEDLALIRSGLSIQFTEDELEAAEIAAQTTRDPDQVLGLRKDLRHLKVFTIDSAETSEIDDGISLEKYTDTSTGKERQRIWIHIADSERWAQRNSALFEVARRRVTSLYLPLGPIPMLPPLASDDFMSLNVGKDAFALSMGVEVLEDGAIDDQSITVTPSLIRVSYRLTYDDVDEMLDEGIGYSEEWELGGLLEFATRRRQYRMNRGSSEAFVPTPIPQKTIKTMEDKNAPDGIGIEVSVQVTHNAGINQTSGAEAAIIDDSSSANPFSKIEPVSSAFTLVTETMILAGEAIGRWKLLQDKRSPDDALKNEIRLPFRTQRKPDFTSRARERRTMMNLLEYNVGGGYCHAWYSRRFLSPVKVTETCSSHSGLGLSCYVQWSSPIRRYSDFMVHIMVKRYLRRQRLQKLLVAGQVAIEDFDLTEEDIGCPIPTRREDDDVYQWNTAYMDADIDYREGGGLVGAARMLQRQSEQYWLFEYIRRIHVEDPDKVWEALVLGYIGSGSKKQYAIYLYELGFEYRITSPVDLTSGVRLKLRLSIINPRAGQLAFVRING